MSELPPQQTSSEQPTPPQGPQEGRQTIGDRIDSASEFTHEAGTQVVERIADITSTTQEWAQERGEDIVGRTVSAGQAAAGGLRRIISTARDKVSEKWSDIGDRRTESKHDASVRRESTAKRKTVESLDKSEKDKQRSRFYRQLGGLVIAKVIGVDKVEAQGIASVVGTGKEKTVELVPPSSKFEEFIEDRAYRRTRKLGEQRAHKSKSGKGSNQTAGIKPWLRQRERLAQVREQYRSGEISREEMERKQLHIRATKSSGFVTTTNRYGERVVQQVAKPGTTQRNRTRVVGVEKFVTKKVGQALQEAGRIYSRDSDKAREKGRKLREKGAEAKRKSYLHAKEAKERAKRKRDKEISKVWDDAHLEDRERFPDEDISKVWDDAHREDERFDADQARKKAAAKAKIPRRTVKTSLNKSAKTEQKIDETGYTYVQDSSGKTHKVPMPPKGSNPAKWRAYENELTRINPNRIIV